jgi:hypothetical protein
MTRTALLVLAGPLLAALYGCNLPDDPEKTVTVEIIGMTVRLTPVGDVDKFSKRITFGKVTEVQGRVVKVDLLLPPAK